MAHWYQQQLRMLQTVLRETDIVGYDARAVAEYMQKSHTNVLIVNVGGIVDFFQNKVEPAHLNPFMKEGQDILADLCRELHSRDMRVMVRVDFRGAQKYRYEARPDWFAAQADGSPKLNAQGLYQPCYLSEYANGHAAEFIREMMRKYPVDGIWENAVAFGGGFCYCARCRADFLKETGLEIPMDEKAASYPAYREWRKRKAVEHIHRIRAAVKEAGDDKAYAAEVFGMYHASQSVHSGLDTYAAEHFDFAVGVGFLTGAPHGRPYDDMTYAGSVVRFLKSIDPRKTTVLLTGDNGTRWRLVKDPTLDSRIYLWEAAAAGGNFWNCMFNGAHPAATEDRRNAYLENGVFGYLEANADVLHGQSPVRQAAIVFSQPSRDTFGQDDEARDGYGVGIKGLEAVLVDEHIPYGFLPERDLTPEKLRDVDVLCMPNCACLSDAQADAVREYVRGGGKLLASFETSLYREDGTKRGDFALTDVLGVHFTGLTKDTSQDCYQMVRLPEHPLAAGMEADKTRFFINGGKTLLVSPEGGETIASYVPIIPNQYPEQAWIREENTRFPTVYAHRFGQGQVVYFANTMEAMVWRNGHEDFYNLVRNALRWLHRGPWMLTTDAPDSVHAGLLRHIDDENSYVLNFVNVLCAPRRAMKRLHPADAFTATLRFPGRTKADIRTLYATEGEIKLLSQKVEGGALVVELALPSFLEYLSAHIRVS